MTGNISNTDVWVLLNGLSNEKAIACKNIMEYEDKLKQELLDKCLGKVGSKRGSTQYINRMRDQIEVLYIKKELYSNLIANIENGVYVEGECS